MIIDNNILLYIVFYEKDNKKFVIIFLLWYYISTLFYLITLIIMKKIIFFLTIVILTIISIGFTNASNRFSEDNIWTIDNIFWKCEKNIKYDKNGELLYWAKYTIDGLYFDFEDKDFEKDCYNKNISVNIKWTWKYSFSVINKEIIFDIHDEKDSGFLTDKLESFVKITEDNNINNEEVDINILEDTIDSLEDQDTEATFDTILSKNKMSYSEKREYIKNNKEAVYQELYEILNLLNKDVQYYEIDEEHSYTETDIFTENTRMIELYK